MFWFNGRTKKKTEQDVLIDIYKKELDDLRQLVKDKNEYITLIQREIKSQAQQVCKHEMEMLKTIIEDKNEYIKKLKHEINVGITDAEKFYKQTYNLFETKKQELLTAQRERFKEEDQKRLTYEIQILAEVLSQPKLDFSNLADTLTSYPNTLYKSSE